MSQSCVSNRKNKFTGWNFCPLLQNVIIIIGYKYVIIMPLITVVVFYLEWIKFKTKAKLVDKNNRSYLKLRFWWQSYWHSENIPSGRHNPHPIAPLISPLVWSSTHSCHHLYSGLHLRKALCSYYFNTPITTTTTAEARSSCKNLHCSNEKAEVHFRSLQMSILL